MGPFVFSTDWLAVHLLCRLNERVGLSADAVLRGRVSYYQSGVMLVLMYATLVWMMYINPMYTLLSPPDAWLKVVRQKVYLPWVPQDLI